MSYGHIGRALQVKMQRALIGTILEFEPEARFQKRAILHERLKKFQIFTIFAQSGGGGLSAIISPCPRG